MLADVPMVFILIGITAYTVLSGADFGAGLWTLVPGGGQAGAAATRDHTRHAIGPVWEANHVWLIFVLTVAWTCYPGAFGSIVSTLAVPLLIAAIGIIFRGTAYALRSQFSRDEEHGVRLVEYLFALSSVLTPFALATVIGAIATGRVPVGNARGDLVTSWLNPVSVLAGVLAVAFSGYLAAVYLAADARRLAERALVHDFRIRALASGAVAGALALAGLLVIRVSAVSLWHGLTSGLGLACVVVSTLAGVVTMVLVFLGRFGPARVSAALAVAAVIAGWAAAQSPLLLPGLTVAEAAAGRSTLIATIVGVAVGAVVLVPSLAVLYSLVLRGRLDTAVVSDSVAAGPASGGAAVSGVVPRAAGRRSPRVPLAAAFAVATLVAGAGLLVFADPAWAHGLGAVALIACAVTVFALASGPAAELPEAGRLSGRQAESLEHAAGEAGHGLDAVAAEGEDEQPVGLRVLGSCGFAQVSAEGELAVGPGGDEPVGAPVPERDLGQEPGDRVVALVLQRRRRHGQPGVVGEQGDNAVHVAALVGAGEPLDELLLPGGFRGRRSVGGARVVVAQGRPGALERAGHGLLGGAEDAGRLAGGEAEHVAQEQHGPLPRRQPLHRGDEGQRDRLACLVPGLRSWFGGGQPLEQVVRTGLEPGRLAEPGGLGRRRARRHRPLAPAHRAPHVQAAAGGDPVQPGPDRGAPLEPAQALPGRQQRVLQGVLRVLHRTEHPVAVHPQFPLVRPDELAERVPVTRAGQVDQVGRHADMVAYRFCLVRPVRGGRGVCTAMSTYLFTFRPPAGYAPSADTFGAWAGWQLELGARLKDRGNPGFAAVSVGARVADTTLGGYSLIRAGSLDAAVALARGCPMLPAGGAVEICELTSHDERFDHWLDTKGTRHD